MHQTRQIASTKLPIPRKGTKYVARASSDLHNSVPVVIAVRDMLKMAHTAREVRELIKNRLLKLNGRPVKDYRESIKIFNILEAGKPYSLTILRTGKFAFKESDSKLRLCKVTNKRILKSGLIQLNLHDGSNIITKDKINVSDSIYLDSEGKIKKHITLDEGKEAFVFSGKYVGLTGKILSIKEDKAMIKFKEKEAELYIRHLILL